MDLLLEGPYAMHLSAAVYLKRVQQQESTAVDAALAQHDLSLSTWCALERIANNPGANTHALAEMTCLTDQSFGSLVTKLADKGLVTRSPGAGRSVEHSLTPEGEEALKASTPTMASVLTEEFSVLSADELETLVRLLQKVSPR